MPRKNRYEKRANPASLGKFDRSVIYRVSHLQQLFSQRRLKVAALTHGITIIESSWSCQKRQKATWESNPFG